jgi:hypothetical protein
MKRIRNGKIRKVREVKSKEYGAKSLFSVEVLTLVLRCASWSHCVRNTLLRDTDFLLETFLVST